MASVASSRPRAPVVAPATAGEHRPPWMITETAPAKVNLTLRVLGRRPDGYHEIESLVVFASVADAVTLDPARLPGVGMSGPFAGAIAGENLAARGLALLAAITPTLRLGHVHIDKSIPVAAGLGGGSADVAAVLRAVRRANPERSADVDWPALAALLGADVAACLASRPALMRGTGADIAVLADFGAPLAAVLVNPRAAVPEGKTAAVYRALAAPPLAPDGAAPSHVQLAAHLASGAPTCPLDRIAAIARIGNDLEPPARTLMPSVSDVLAALAATQGCRLARLTGSGPTCFGLYETENAAGAAAAALASAHPSWWVRPARLGSGSDA